jgi:hypothetical protein
MKEPEITCDWIDRYNDHELDGTEMAIFQKRLQSNPLLRSEVHIDACLNRFLMDDEVIDLMNKLNTSARRKPDNSRLLNTFLIAASVLCLAMIGGLFYLLRTNQVTTTMQIHQHTNEPGYRQGHVADMLKFTFSGPDPLNNALLSCAKATRRGLNVKDFTLLPEFELLIGSVTRSSRFKLISPDVNITVFKGTEVLFDWSDDEKTGPVCIVMMNNRGMAVSDIPVAQAGSFVLSTNWFREGLYYWKIMMGDDLVLMGKITIL